MSKREIGDEPLAVASLPHSPTLAAERMRRHRKRRRDGFRRLHIELRATEIDALTRRGFLKEDARNDLNEVRKAFYAYLDHTLGATS
jgi:hypothetical protein